MNRIILLILITLVGCKTQGDERGNTYTLKRFENDEVVCYRYKSSNAGGLSCKWKDVK